jgi:hypothetical protein
MAEPEEFDLEQLSEDEKDELIISLAEKLNKTYAVAASLFNALQAFRGRLEEYDVFGKRGAVMRDTAWRMLIICNLSLSALDIDIEQLEADAEFERITAHLEDDDE